MLVHLTHCGGPSARPLLHTVWITALVAAAAGQAHRGRDTCISEM